MMRNRQKNERQAYKRLFENAINIKNEGRTEEAKAAFRQLTEDYPDESAAFYLLAGILLDEGRAKEASRLFQILVSRHPKSERFSVGLFLSFWDLAEYDLALSEILRYVASESKLEEYQVLLADLRKEIAQKSDLLKAYPSLRNFLASLEFLT